MLAEAREKNVALVDAFKLAVISADPDRYIPLSYPEWMVKRDDEITTEDLEESAGEWKFEQTDVSLEDIEATLAELLADNTISLGPDIDGEAAATHWDEWDDEQAPPDDITCTE